MTLQQPGCVGVCVCVCVCPCGMALQLDWHPPYRGARLSLDLSPTLNNIFSDASYILSVSHVFAGEGKSECEDGGFISRRAAQMNRWPLPLNARRSGAEKTSKPWTETARAVFSQVVLYDCFFSGDSCWQEGERRIEFSRSAFHHRRTNEWIWATTYFFRATQRFVRTRTDLHFLWSCTCNSGEQVEVVS